MKFYAYALIAEELALSGFLCKYIYIYILTSVIILWFKSSLFIFQIDHFGFANENTYKQKYLIADQFWKKNGPIFFYTGNEGAIEWFCNNTVSIEYVLII